MDKGGFSEAGKLTSMTDGKPVSPNDNDTSTRVEVGTREEGREEDGGDDAGQDVVTGDDRKPGADEIEEEEEAMLSRRPRVARVPREPTKAESLPGWEGHGAPAQIKRG